MSFFVHPCPRILIAGLGGGSGKTIVSLGLARAFVEQGHRVQTFKKGPDYIDAKWLSLASRSITSNLDPFLLSSTVLRNLFWDRAFRADLSIIEGNRGLYDGKDVAGTYSSAELAKSLESPVIIVADCTKVTRTMAAILLGLCVFDSEVNIQGVILNRTAGCRHQSILRQTIEQYTDVQVLGIIPKLPTNPIPERHMGLVSVAELCEDPFTAISTLLRENVNLSEVLRIATAAPPVTDVPQPIFSNPEPASRVRIGVVRDAAFWFYYQENLDALRHAGAEVVEFSLLTDTNVPDVHAVYMGGGFPETMARDLAQNTSMRSSVHMLVEQGLPVYAECGGLMYLGKDLEFNNVIYPMTGVFPLGTRVFPKPQGHGYIRARVHSANPFYVPGTILTGHEFHYSKCTELSPDESFVFRIERGQGMTSGWDGVVYRNCLAGYTHTHALGHIDWALNFVAAATRYRESLRKGISCPDIRI